MKKRRVTSGGHWQVAGLDTVVVQQAGLAGVAAMASGIDMEVAGPEGKQNPLDHD